MAENYLLKLYKKTMKLPLGAQIFSQISARRVPYFRSISPRVERLEHNFCQVLVRKRRAVTNHIGTMHVIAVANGLEMAMGFMAEASIPPHLRWIPKGMNLDYLIKGETDITCTAQVSDEDWQAGDMLIPVKAVNTSGELVVSGSIKLWITEKKPRDDTNNSDSNN
jgi:acyl-coenzyme A thioesterase PaaI-like protein